MSDLTDYLVKGGYWTAEGKNIYYDPVDFEDINGDVIGDICPIGYNCPMFLSFIYQCRDGFTSQLEGLSTC